MEKDEFIYYNRQTPSNINTNIVYSHKPKTFNFSSPQNECVPTDGTFESVIVSCSKCLSLLKIGPMAIEFDGPRMISTRVLSSINRTGIELIPPENCRFTNALTV